MTLDRVAEALPRATGCPELLLLLLLQQLTHVLTVLLLNTALSVKDQLNHCFDQVVLAM